MVDHLALAFAIASFNAAAEPPRFADDFPQGVGYVAVIEVLPDAEGLATTCTLSSVHALTKGTPPVNIAPPDAYVIDACRKMRTAKWPVTRDAAGRIEAQPYFCRYVATAPETAFCDTELGL